MKFRIYIILVSNNSCHFLFRVSLLLTLKIIKQKRKHNINKQYRHPHIAYAALEVHLANKVLPKTCATTWLENNPHFLEKSHVSTPTPFPVMENDDSADDTLENWLGQPKIPYEYKIADARPAAGNYANVLVLGGTKLN